MQGVYIPNRIPRALGNSEDQEAITRIIVRVAKNLEEGKVSNMA